MTSASRSTQTAPCIYSMAELWRTELLPEELKCKRFGKTSATACACCLNSQASPCFASQRWPSALVQTLRSSAPPTHFCFGPCQLWILTASLVQSCCGKALTLLDPRSSTQP